MKEKILEILKDNKEWNSSLEYTAKELLNLFNVSQQRELLNAFVDFYNDRQLNSDNICYDEIDLFLDSI